jgi:hypothetical protein
MPESDIPQMWRDRGLQYFEKLRSLSPPEYKKEAEQAGSCDAEEAV